MFLTEVNYLIIYWRYGETKNYILDGDILEEIQTKNGKVLLVEKVLKAHKKVKGIYIVFNIVNKKGYVGQTINLYKRKNNHIAELRRNNHPNIYLQRSWDKYGKNKFIVYVLEIVDNINDLNARELYYIKLLETRMNSYGYNMKLDTYSREDENISKDQNRECPYFRKPVVQLDFNGNFIARYDGQEVAAIKNNLYQSQVGYCCNKIRGSSGGYLWIYENEYNDESFNFIEYLKTIPKFHMKSKNGIRNIKEKVKVNRRVLQIDKNNNNIIKIWDSPAKTKEFGFNPNKIYECCSGKIKTHKGFMWNYEKNVV